MNGHPTPLEIASGVLAGLAVGYVCAHVLDFALLVLVGLLE